MCIQGRKCGIINAIIILFSFAAMKRLLNHFARLDLWYNEPNIVLFGVAAR